MPGKQIDKKRVKKPQSKTTVVAANAAALRTNIMQAVTVCAVIGGMVWFGIWYFRASMGELPAALRGTEAPFANSDDTGQTAASGTAMGPLAGTVAAQPTVQNGTVNSAACGVRMQVPGDWQTAGTAVPLTGAPREALTMTEAGRTVFWFACFDARQYELADIVGKDVALQAVEEKTIGGVAFKRTPSFWYATHNGRHLFLQVNFARYDARPEAGYEEVTKKIVEGIRFLP